MMDQNTDLREILCLVACALLSLLAFTALVLFWVGGGWWSVLVALLISLACPLVWLVFLLQNKSGGEGGLAQWAKRRARHPRRVQPRENQPAGARVKA